MRIGAVPLLALLAACTAAPGGEGVEVAVAFDQAGERGAFARGFADRSTKRAATPDDPVRIASISKLVVAIGVMRLVETGALDLDRPVGEYLGYRVANPAFTGQPVTLRRLLSHTSSLRDRDDQYAIPLGETLRGVLDDPASWDAIHGPDAAYFTYANLNFPLVASIVETVRGERFDVAMKRLVIDPMRLDACFNWPTCDDGRVARAIVLTQNGKVVRDDLNGRRPDCPVFVREGRLCDLGRVVPGENGALFAPQGGLRISARGLVRVGRMLLAQGTLDGVRILRSDSVAQLTRPAWQYDGRNGATEGGVYCRYGLAVHLLATPTAGCADDPGLPRGDWIGHSGEAYGLRSGLWLDRLSGAGIAYFATGLPAVPRKGVSGFTAREERLVRRSVALGQQRP